jgi:hypothetical protein
MQVEWDARVVGDCDPAKRQNLKQVPASLLKNQLFQLLFRFNILCGFPDHLRHLLL